MEHFAAAQFAYTPPAPFVDPERLALSRELLARHRPIQAEAAALLEVPFWPAWRPYGEPDSYAGEGQWESVALFGDGHFNEALLRRCPATRSILEQVSDMRQALFSSLSPRTRILPHRGAPGIVRVHLALLTEPGQAGWRVEGVERPCVEGQVVIFEDGCMHEAWNDASSHRITLLFDMPAPHLSHEQRRAALAAYDRQMAVGRASLSAKP